MEAVGSIEDLNKAGYRPKFVSEYSMGQYDFERYNNWLKEVERYSAIISSTAIPDLPTVQNYFASLNVLWKSWRPIVSVKSIKEEVDNAVKECRRKKRVWEDSQKTGVPMNTNLIRQLTDGLDEIHTKLMDLKQVIGLGIKVNRNMTMAEKIKRGIHGDKDFSNLPEA